ncbi:lysoplasmalogenase-like protein TMEM86A [Condylostylus longicornis]|uniref:lysoplasmalogenase-like protein TMEM86A n=1 Tax=Condylostylus longicornis TaxID=2530218 RepID=UPI00244DF0BC|nr:lysoplasmalogenase-like protein TMEM86A [Condylostylus longicornis]
MEEHINLLKTAGPRMVPFIKAVTIYFMLVTFDPKGEIWTTILKCAPIVCLMFFILLYGFKFTKKSKYCQRILFGLIFSCVGDALLNVALFPHGMGSFAVAQAFYISAFGFQPFKPWIAIGLYAFAISFISLIFHSLDEILVIGLPIYAFLLTTMCWRTLARAGDKPNIINILCAIGGILFVISDGIIAVDRFYIKIPNSRIYIMTTYYAAQFAITLSIVNERKAENQQTMKSNPNSQLKTGLINSNRISVNENDKNK